MLFKVTLVNLLDSAEKPTVALRTDSINVAMNEIDAWRGSPTYAAVLGKEQVINPDEINLAA